ncbi:hypothetical protein OE88DRAFT_1720292 [Heliocybe sulcata]|uniref:G protein-coupled receptor 89 n=1 Tax=Heliocybe sulcata TaxID=5364 RepID=A0A5C3MWQ3_9AGAM|nr:hypothetical protein OE88DRAFT_1720292 [Heliocybe sulcata]
MHTRYGCKFGIRLVQLGFCAWYKQGTRLEVGGNQIYGAEVTNKLLWQLHQNKELAEKNSEYFMQFGISHAYAQPQLTKVKSLGSQCLLFASCRKYLLRSLYHDLQSLSSPEGQDVPMHGRGVSEDVELGTLPAPSTSSGQSASLKRRRPLHSTLSRGLFAICFSESCVLFFLLMCQGLDILDARTRLVNWRISLSVLLSAILVLVPLCLNLILTYTSTVAPNDATPHSRSIFTRLLLTISPVFAYLLLLSYVPLPAALTSAGITTSTLARLIVVGTIILGLLSGFGAISNAWAFFPLFSREKRVNPSSDDVVAATHALDRVRSDLMDRRAELKRLRNAQPESQTGWLSRMTSSFRGDSQLSSLSQEISGLEALEYQMSLNLEDMKQRQSNAHFSRTLPGKLFNLGGRLFALYCIFRVLSSIINVTLPMRSREQTSSPDLIAHYLVRLLSFFPSVDIPEKDVALVSRQISLALVGLIILSSIRLVLRGVARILRVTNRNLGASLMLVILAQLMGIYLLSTLIQLRTTFPPPPVKPGTDVESSGETNLFSTLPEYQVFGSLFDGSFLIAAGVTATVRWLNERVNGPGT